MERAIRVVALLLSVCCLGLLVGCGDGNETREVGSSPSSSSTQPVSPAGSMRYFLLEGKTPTLLSADGGGTETGPRHVPATSLRNDAGTRARVMVVDETVVTEGASVASPVVSVGQHDDSSAVVYADVGDGVQAVVTISGDRTGQATTTGEALARNLAPFDPDRPEDGMTSSSDSGFVEVARRPSATSTTAGRGGNELVDVGGVEVSLDFRMIDGPNDLDVVAAPMIARIEADGGRQVVVFDGGDATGVGSSLVFVDGGYQVTLSGSTTADRLRELVGSVKSVDRAAWGAAADQAFATATAEPADLDLTDDQVGDVRVWLGGNQHAGVACSDGKADLADRCSYLAGVSPILVRIPSTGQSLVLACNLGDGSSASVSGAAVRLRSIGACSSGFLVQVDPDEEATVTIRPPGSPEVPDLEQTTVLLAQAPTR